FVSDALSGIEPDDGLEMGHDRRIVKQPVEFQVGQCVIAHVEFDGGQALFGPRLWNRCSTGRVDRKYGGTELQHVAILQALKALHPTAIEISAVPAGQV